MIAASDSSLTDGYSPMGYERLQPTTQPWTVELRETIFQANIAPSLWVVGSFGELPIVSGAMWKVSGTSISLVIWRIQGIQQP
jgi:hypothetical protein